MLFSRLQVSPEVTVFVEVSPRLLFNVHGYKSGHIQAFQIYSSLYVSKTHDGHYRI